MRIILLAALGAVSCCIAASAQAEPTGFEREVLAEINFVRAHPQDFADELRVYRDSFDGLVAHENGDPVGVYTHEGVPAVDEAITFLERQQSLPPLAPGDVLALAARDHVAEQGPLGTIAHISPDGRTPGLRVKAHGGDIFIGETISYGETAAAAVVRQFVIDDGEPRRGHRALLFSAGYRFAGVGCGAHARYGEMCVVDYAATADGRPAPPVAVAVVATPVPAK